MSLSRARSSASVADWHPTWRTPWTPHRRPTENWVGTETIYRPSYARRRSPQPPTAREVKPEHFVAVGDRPFVIAVVIMRSAAGCERILVIGLEPYYFIVIGYGPGIVVLVVVGETACVERANRLRVDADRLAVIGNSVVVVFLVLVGIGTAKKRRKVGWGQPECFGEIGDCATLVVLLREGAGPGFRAGSLLSNPQSRDRGRPAARKLRRDCSRLLRSRSPSFPVRICRVRAASAASTLEVLPKALQVPASSALAEESTATAGQSAPARQRARTKDKKRCMVQPPKYRRGYRSNGTREKLFSRRRFPTRPGRLRKWRQRDWRDGACPVIWLDARCAPRRAAR